MAIREFGESLLADVRERKDSQARDAQKYAKKQRKKEVLLASGAWLGSQVMKIGNSVLDDKNEKFLQNENFYARNAKLKSNIAENNKALNRWNTSLAYEGGQDAYYSAEAQAQIEQKFMTDDYKASLGSPAEYAAHMQTFSGELGLVMKENAKANFEQASANVSAWSNNPEAAFKKSVLRGRPETVAQSIALPLVNLFRGQDERTPTQAAIDSIESEKGLESQGKVDAKDVRNIYEQTNNFKYALDTAIELKEFRERFKAAGDILPKAPAVRGETYTAKVTNNWGVSQDVSVYDLTINGIRISTHTLDIGEPITAQISSASLARAAQEVPKNEIEAIGAVHRELSSEKDKKEVLAYKEEWLGTNAPTDKEIAAFDQNFYGKVAIGAKTLSTKFKSVEGLNADFATQWSTQMTIENLKATKKTTGFIFKDTAYNNEKGLLNHDDHYHPVIALKALKTLESRGDIPPFLIPQLEDAIGKADYSARNLNVSQKLTASDTYKSMYPSKKPEPTGNAVETGGKPNAERPPQSTEKIIEEVTATEQVSLLEEPEVIDPNETKKEKRERKRRAGDKLRKEREQKIKEGLSSFLSSVQSNEGITTRNYNEYTD